MLPLTGQAIKPILLAVITVQFFMTTIIALAGKALWSLLVLDLAQAQLAQAPIVTQTIR